MPPAVRPSKPKPKEKPKAAPVATVVEDPKVTDLVLYEVASRESGEVVAIYSREAFMAMTLEKKAESYAQLDQFLKTLNKYRRELEALLTVAMHAARPDPSKPVNVPTSIPGVTISLPSGLEDKTLGVGETQAFAEELHKISEQAEKDIVSYRPTIDKKAVNKWRTVPGPVADLIVRVYQPHPKAVEVKVTQ